MKPYQQPKTKSTTQNPTNNTKINQQHKTKPTNQTNNTKLNQSQN